MAYRPHRPWRERWLELRDRWLADARFQRFAASFPLTRPIAERRMVDLFDLCAGFVYSQVLQACVRLGLLQELAAGAQTVAVLAARTAMSREVMTRLLDAAVALRLLERRGVGKYGLGALGAALLGNPGALAMIEHHSLLYADLADPVALLRGQLSEPQLARFWSYAGNPDAGALDDVQTGAYSRLMSASQALVAGDILDACAPDRWHRLLDVGGGEGGFLCAAAARAPELELMLFDLPAVADRARCRLAEAGLAARSQVYGGDVRLDPLPRGADLISLVRVLHDHDDAAATRILSAVHEALEPRGALLVAEPLAGTRGAERMGDAYFGIYLLAMGSGRPRTAGELIALLQRTGFSRCRQLRTRRPMLTSVLLARV